MAHKHHTYNECSDINALTIKEYSVIKSGSYTCNHDYYLELTPENALNMLKKIASDVIMEELMDNGEVHSSLTVFNDDMANDVLASGHDSVTIHIPNGNNTYVLAIVYSSKDSMIL